MGIREHLSEKNFTIAQAASWGMAWPRNMLVVPGTKRGVWVDFSCAQIGEERHHYEMFSGGGTAVEHVNLSF
jgi:uncharacterized protein (DUF486 family)